MNKQPREKTMKGGGQSHELWRAVRVGKCIDLLRSQRAACIDL